MLKGRHILLGITGSIAAYKSALIVRELVKLGAEVKVICTPAALDFVTPLTLSTLSKNPVFSSFIRAESTGEWVNHVELGKWADLMLIAPLSAHTLSKICNGACDNLLVATYLSADCPIYVAPAMDLDMYKHWTTKRNFEILESNDITIIDSQEGELASGLYGKGRMAEVNELIEIVQNHFSVKSKISGKKIIVTAGPTYEPIDPVRFIGNHSSGKMGFAIAEAAARRGADVTLIAGPSGIKTPKSVSRVDVITAADMLIEVQNKWTDCDALIMSAAVADFTPVKTYSSKQKKESGALEPIELKQTADILKTVAAGKKNQIVIGFALETDNEIENAQKKLISKNLDMLVLNSLKDDGAGFGTDTNKVTFIKNNEIREMPLKSKHAVAIDIINELEALY